MNSDNRQKSSIFAPDINHIVYHKKHIKNEQEKDIVFYLNTIMPVGAAVAAKLSGKKIVYHYHENASAKSRFYVFLAWFFTNIIFYLVLCWTVLFYYTLSFFKGTNRLLM